MALMIAQVVNEARDLHPALSTTNAPLAIAYRALTRFERDIIKEITHKVPAFFALTATFAIPADFTVGIDLQALIGQWVDLVDLFFRYAQTPTPPRTVRAPLIPWEQRDGDQPLPSATFRGNSLFLLGDPSDYSQFDQATLSYTPTSGGYSKPGDTMLLPDDALTALAHLLAGFWLGRLVGNPKVQVDADTAAMHTALGAASAEQFTARVGGLAQRQDYRVRDVR